MTKSGRVGGLKPVAGHARVAQFALLLWSGRVDRYAQPLFNELAQGDAAPRRVLLGLAKQAVGDLDGRFHFFILTWDHINGL